MTIEDAGIRAYLPLPDFEHRTAFFGRGAFGYDAERDQYRCPEDHYRADPATCNACPVKAACTESGRGRIVHRSVYADYLDKVRAYHATEGYKKAIRKRQMWVEPLFAEAKEWHGLRRLRLWGLENANIQGLLVAAGQNLKRLLAATGWGRRYSPSGSLVGLPKPPERPVAVSVDRRSRSEATPPAQADWTRRRVFQHAELLSPPADLGWCVGRGVRLAPERRGAGGALQARPLRRKVRTLSAGCRVPPLDASACLTRAESRARGAPSPPWRQPYLR